VPTKQPEPDYEEMPKQRKSEHKSGGGFGTYLAMFLVLVCTLAFIAQHWLGLNVTGLFSNNRGRDDRAARPGRARPYGFQEGSGIREP